MSSVGEMTEVELQVRHAAQALIDASLDGDVERVLACYRPDTPFVEQGRITDRFDELEDSIREFFMCYRVKENALRSVRVEVIAPTVAVLTARYSFLAVNREGAKMKSDGAWSAVFVLDPTGWRIVVPHQSVPTQQT